MLVTWEIVKLNIENIRNKFVRNKIFNTGRSYSSNDIFFVNKDFFLKKGMNNKKDKRMVYEKIFISSVIFLPYKNTCP